MLSSASVFLSLIVVYFCRSGECLTFNLKERNLNIHNIKVNRSFYHPNNVADGYKVLFTSLRKPNFTSSKLRKSTIFFYQSLQAHKNRLKLRKRYLELLNRLNNSENISSIHWHRNRLNIFDTAGNIRPQYLDTPLALRAQQLMATTHSGDSFVSYFLQPLAKLWHPMSFPISTDMDERRFYKNNSDASSSQKTFSFVDLHRRERSLESGGQARSEIDLGGENIDADSIVPRPRLQGQEEISLATYVYIPTTYIGT